MTTAMQGYPDAAAPTGSAARATCGVASQPLRNVTIVLVEDEGLLVFYLERLLMRAGARVVGIASSGPEAVEQVRATHPDLVLTEVLLSGPYDGIEAARRIKAICPASIAVFSSQSALKTQRRAREVGIDAYLIKPLTAAQIVSALADALQLRGVR